MVCLRNISVDTLYKGDTEDSNNNNNNINNNNNNNNNKIRHTWNVKAKLMPVIKGANGNTRSNGKQSTPKAEEGYCNIEATQSRPLTHSQSHQTQNTGKHTGVKQRRAWTKEEIREVIWCYILATYAP
jgi:hypothetical protein